MEDLPSPSSVAIERSPLFPNPITCINDILHSAASEFVSRSPFGVWEQWLSETLHWIRLSLYFDPMMIIYATIICIVLTLIRSVLDRQLFRPLTHRYKLSKEAANKFPESIWKFGVYLITWMWAAYLTHTRDIMFDLASHWNKWYPGIPVDSTIYWLFTFEVGFYLHYSYGMLFLEARKKDFAVLMLHHVLTILLIVGCYSTRFHIIGVFLIFIHDIGDVFLEGSKCLNYLKEQDGKLVKLMDMCANIGFLMFAAEYFLFRIYWFVTKALYSSLHVCVLIYPGGPFYLPFNIMLLALLAMQVYWFGLIVKLLVKVLILREELADIREVEEDGEGEGAESNDRGRLTKKQNGDPSFSPQNKKKEQ